MLFLFAQAFDAQSHDIAMLQEHRWLLSQPDTRRRAGGDQVAGLQGHKLADVMDQLGNIKNHG